MPGAKKWTLDLMWDAARTSEWKVHRMIKADGSSSSGHQKAGAGHPVHACVPSFLFALFSQLNSFLLLRKHPGASPLLQKSLNA